MGIPTPAGVGASGTPPAGDKANAVVSGIVTSKGPSLPFAFYGPFNLLAYASINTSLTVIAGSNAFTVVSGTGLAVGAAINSALVPPGTTILTLVGTSGTLAFPPNSSANGVFSGTDTFAIFTGAAISFVGTIQLERSFDGGYTWIVCNSGNTGTLAQWTAGTPISLTVSEVEKQVIYRINCIAYTSGTINYRLSTSGVSAMSVSAPAVA